MFRTDLFILCKPNDKTGMKSLHDNEKIDLLSKLVWPDELGSMSRKTFDWTRINEPEVFKNAAQNWLEGCTGHYRLFRDYAILWSKYNKQ